MKASVRLHTEEMERGTLSSLAALSERSAGRDTAEAEDELRTCYQRDRDRIIHCNAFRRLKYKTQVFLSPEGDHYRTRLTHTLEVSQIARTIARALRLNEDLTEAIALGHDLGHTPFGHAGERALDACLPGGFRHYEQSVRVVERLEKGGRGLNLTAEVRDGIRCHTSGQEAATLEGRVVRIADKIAYLNHDIDDAVRARVLREEDIPPVLRQKFGRRRSERINTMVIDVVENSADTIAMSPTTATAFDQLHEFLFRSVYRNPIAKGEESKAVLMLNQMYHYLCGHPQLLPGEHEKTLSSEGIERAVCDYIAGMTDRYAVKMYNDIFVPHGWSR